MLVGSELALDRAQIERSNNRKSAIMAKGSLQGYKFIRLVLKNIRKKRISGVDVLSAQEFTNENLGGVLDYQLELRGGDINFEYRPEFGQFIFDLVDTERNRNFLASHLEYNFWDITDPMVVFDVKNRYEKMKEEILKPRPPEKSLAEKFWEEARGAENQYRKIVRGEETPEVVPQLQPVLVNEPGTPGHIPEYNQVKLTPKPLKGKRGWQPGVPRGSKAATNKDEVLEALEGKKQLKAERDVDSDEPSGIGVVQP